MKKYEWSKENYQTPVSVYAFAEQYPNATEEDCLSYQAHWEYEIYNYGTGHSTGEVGLSKLIDDANS